MESTNQWIRVSIHVPARGATFTPTGNAAVIWFRSTPPRGGRPPPYTGDLTILMFRSTPPRGGRRQHSLRSFCQDLVSIHAPARGATLRIRVHLQHTRVSIHAPAWGATAASSALLSFIASFDPRPRAGGDFDQPVNLGRIQVSIHAPARGATFPVINHSSFTPFRSTPPRGGRHCG